MEDRELLKYIDHTLLKADCTWEQIAALCKEAVELGTASVCIPPCYIARAHEAFPTLNLCTVIGFPLGYSVTAAKAAEARQAIEEGANEIDTVVNVSDVKNGRFDEVLQELKTLREVCSGKILKVIIETCYLTEEEKIRLCQIVTEAKADFIKTSTGFGTAGATLEDVKLMKANIGPEVKIKAAGGIRTIEDARGYVEAGCSRIGSSAVAPLIAKQS